VSAASLLDVSEDTDKKGKKYYKYELLVRSGEETRGWWFGWSGALLQGLHGVGLLAAGVAWCGWC
jgi:hypothetical protein